MKEIWMEKLIELLETFEKESVEKLKSDVWKNDTISPRVWSVNDIQIYEKLRVISKEMWFIKWLIEHDKIDLKKLGKTELYLKIARYWSLLISDNLIMLLSISDTPIEDLISYLK